MHHELLLALLGISGDVFVDASPESGPDSPLVVAPDLPLPPPEREALERLLVLGAQYRSLEAFVSAETEAGEAGGGSLYRRAAAAGIDEALGEYRAEVLRLEQEVLSGELAVGPAGLLGGGLAEAAALLSSLHALATQLRRDGDTGGRLLALLAERRACAGAPALRRALGRACRCADAAALRQLCGWALHGQLFDPHEEFFVLRLAPAATSGEAEAEAEEADGGAASWHSAYGLRLQHPLPPWLELPGSETVLFIGRAVRCLDNPRGRFASLPPEELLPHSQRAAWAAKLQQLLPAEECAEGLRRDHVEAALNWVRREAGARLWDLVGRRAGLEAHLAALFDFLLLGRGELVAALMEERWEGGRDEAAVRAAWSAAAQRCGAADEPLFENVRLVFDPRGVAGGDAWEGLALSYRAEWPLGLLLSPATLMHLQGLSIHMLRLRAAQSALSGCWASLRGRGSRQLPSGSCAALSLRARMAALLDAWAQYLQAQVAQPAHAQLLARVREAGEAGGGGWGTAARGVASFTAELQGGAFLELQPVSSALSELHALAHALAAMAAQAQKEGPAPAGEEGVLLRGGRLAELEVRWERAAKALLAALKGPQLAAAGARAPALPLLLERLETCGPQAATE